jgi:hypothetical protein
MIDKINETYEMLGACKHSTLHNVKVIAIISLLDDELSWMFLDVLHGIEYNF